MSRYTEDFFKAQTAEDKTLSEEAAPKEEKKPEIDPREEPEEKESKEVPSFYPDHDPDFARPIFRKRVDTPPAAPTGSIIRKTSVPSRPAGTRPAVPRREDTLVNLAPLPLKKIETGLNSLDVRTGGFAVGSINILSGVDSTLRSHLAYYIARNVVEGGGRVLALISPTEEGHWTPMPNLFVDIAVRRSLEELVETLDEAGRTDLVIMDPLHSIETPPEHDRVAAMDLVLSRVLTYIRRKRTSMLAVSHFVDRASRHEGVSLHPWMFRDVSCLMDLAELILILRTHRSGQREILTYRKGLNNRIGGLPSFVLPWV